MLTTGTTAATGYPGLGNRSVFGSVGNAFTFGVVGRSLRTLLLQKRLGVRPHKHVSLVPRHLDEADRSEYGRIRYRRQTSRRLEGGGNVE